METHVVYGLIALAGYGLAAVFYKVADGRMDYAGAALVGSFVMFMVSLAWWLLHGGGGFNAAGVLASAAAGFLSGAGFLAYVAAIERGSVSAASAFRGMSVLLATVVSAVFLGERVGLRELAGIALAFASIVLLSG